MAAAFDPTPRGRDHLNQSSMGLSEGTREVPGSLNGNHVRPRRYINASAPILKAAPPLDWLEPFWQICDREGKKVMNEPTADLSTEVSHYRTAKVADLDIFYREAGSSSTPTILLLHGFPTSSHMFRDLIPRLADRFHVIAPDYPGFGFSSTPSVTDFEYTFDHLAEVIEQFTDAVGLEHYAIYAQDFGGPVGFRLAAARPERVRALIVQNANAYSEGVSPELRAILLRLYNERTPQMRQTAGELFELSYTKRQFLEGVEDPTRVSPDAWQHAQWGLDRPGNKDIQYALHANYASNFDRYDEWQAYFRRHQPPTLIVWGKGDFVFGVPGAEAYQRDLEKIEMHFLNAGHFALETHASEIAAHMRRFLSGPVNEWVPAPA
jgi:pimeloyl-ACP methyl ester carboxylesterase